MVRQYEPRRARYRARCGRQRVVERQRTEARACPGREVEQEGEHDGVVVCGLVVHRTMVVMVREAVEDDGVGVPKNECLAR